MISSPESIGSAPSSSTTLSNLVQRLLTGTIGHATQLGLIGSCLIFVGGLGAGSTRTEDPLLETAHLSWVRFGHGYVLASITVWVGVVLMIAAWVRLGRIVLAEGMSLRELRGTLTLWVLPLLISVPMFSRDAYSYLAQGALLRDGADPYAVGPVELNSDLLLDNVSYVWRNTTAPYGPVFLLIGRGITSITGDNVVAGTILMRLAMLPGLILMAWAIPHIARHLGGSGSSALWLAVLNPLVLIHLIGGVHNEMLMVGLMAAGIALVLEHRHAQGIAIVAVGAAIKATAGVALPFLIWIWMVHERDRQLALGKQESWQHSAIVFLRAATLGAVSFVTVFAAATLIAGVDLGWIGALQGSAKIVNWLSVPTILAHIVTWVTPIQLTAVLDVTRIVCGVALLGTLIFAGLRFRNSERDAILGILVAFVGIVLLSPAALPWYYSWPLALAAGFAQTRTSLMVLVGLSTWLMLTFNPDGATGLYHWAHVIAATALAILAAMSLRTVDVLRMRQPDRRDALLREAKLGPYGSTPVEV